MRRQARPTRWGLLAGGLAAAIAAGPPLHAGSPNDCGAEVRRLAEEFGIELDVPQAVPVPPEAPDGPSVAVPEADQPLAETLAESGGVIAPPDTGTTRIIEPPPVDPAMPTAPDVAPGPPGEEAPPPDLEAAATRERVAALLVAAHQASQDGDAAACAARLEEALALIQE